MRNNVTLRRLPHTPVHPKHRRGQAAKSRHHDQVVQRSLYSNVSETCETATWTNKSTLEKLGHAPSHLPARRSRRPSDHATKCEFSSRGGHAQHHPVAVPRPGWPRHINHRCDEFLPIPIPSTHLHTLPLQRAGGPLTVASVAPAIAQRVPRSPWRSRVSAAREMESWRASPYANLS